MPDCITFTPLLVDGRRWLYLNIHTQNLGLFTMPLDPASAAWLGEALTSYSEQVTVH